jgi:hypothetical protein
VHGAGLVCIHGPLGYHNVGGSTPGSQEKPDAWHDPWVTAGDRSHGIHPWIKRTVAFSLDREGGTGGMMKKKGATCVQGPWLARRIRLNNSVVLVRKESSDSEFKVVYVEELR